MFDKLTDQEIDALWGKMASAGDKWGKLAEFMIWANVSGEAWRSVRDIWQETVVIRDDLFAAQYPQYARA